MDTSLRIAIAGAGIGGLAFASFAAKQGFRPDIFEQAETLGEIGAGIQMSANGTRLLHSIGLEGKLAAIGHRPKRYVFRLFQSKEILQEIPLGDTHAEKHGAPYYTFHRADLHKALVDLVESNAPGSIRLNARMTSFKEGDDGVRLEFARGDAVDADVLVGADGIRSATRDGVLGRKSPEFTGQCAWRLTIPAAKAPRGLTPDDVTVWVAPGGHAVTYFVRGGDLLNFVGVRRTQTWTAESWTATAPWQALRDDYADWNDDIRAIVDAADPSQCFRWALYGRAPARRWSSDRVTLLGDAAHPTLPYLAQGAVMAVEDGAVLAAALARATDLKPAFAAYEAARIDRAARIVTESADNARLFQLDSEAALKKAFAERNMSSERNSWLYAYRAEAALSARSAYAGAGD